MKQVVTDPNYVAGKHLVSNREPSIQEQKAQALDKLAAYNKSSDILKLIKSRLNDNEQL